MAYLKVKGRVGVSADRAAAMAKDPGLLTRWLQGVAIVDLGDDRTDWEIDGGPAFRLLRMPTGDKRLVRWRTLSGPHHTGVLRFRPGEVIVEVAWDGGKARQLRRSIRAALRDFAYEAERLPVA